jgi:hypothetical protein
VFDEVTKEVSSEMNVTLSKVMVISEGLNGHCLELIGTSFESEDIKNLTQSLFEQINTKLYRKYLDLSLVWEATLLDSRFRELGFSEDNKIKCTKDAIINKCTAILKGRNRPTETDIAGPSTVSSELQGSVPELAVPAFLVFWWYGVAEI